MENISQNLLLAKGWQKVKLPFADYIEYSLDFDNVHFRINNCSNMVGRDWNIHVDNCDFESIGSCNIQTTEQFNLFLKCLDIDYEL